jgi:ATP-grasp domain, R2K clade family 3
MNALAERVVSEAKRVADLLTVDPFGPAMEGGFWSPNMAENADIRILSEHESFGVRGAPFTMRLRFMPTDAVLSAVRRAYGPLTDALMMQWRALFDRIEGGLDRFVKETAYEAFLDYSSTTRVSDRTASRLILGHGGLTEAHELYAAATDIAAGPAPRLPEQHALEDALVMTSFVRNKVPVTFLVLFDTDKASIPADKRTVRLLSFSRSGKPRVKTPTRSATWRLREGFRVSNPYWGWPSFRQVCGRALQDSLGIRQLTLTLLDMARQGARKAFVKNAAFKGGTWVIGLDDVKQASDAACALVRAVGPNWPRLLAPIGSDEALDPCFIVQEFKPFKYEHRFFIVADRIVASTPSDRTLTVLDAQTGPRRLDPRVAVLEQPAEHTGAFDRGTTSSIEDRRMVAAMTRLVRRFLHAHNSGDSRFIPRPPAYVIDVGAGIDGSPGLVEINTFRNSGLYAVDYGKIAAAFCGKHSWTERSFAERLLADPEAGPGGANLMKVVFKMATAVGSSHTWQVVEQEPWRPLTDEPAAATPDD